MAPYYAPGTYDSTLTGQGFAETEFGTQFYLKIQPDVDGEARERTVFLPLCDANGERALHADKTIEVLRYLGFCGSEADLARLSPHHERCHSFVGMRVKAYCQHKANKAGQIGERWYINTPRSGGEMKEPDPIAIQRLQALFGKELRIPQPDAPAGNGDREEAEPERLNTKERLQKHLAGEPVESQAEEKAADIPF
jgi:hypothetical protein